MAKLYRARQVVVTFLLQVVALSFALQCNPNPCLNGGECVKTLPSSGYSCICPEAYAGINCNLAFPSIKCGNKSIEILIDERMVTEQGLPADTKYVHFMGSTGCMAVLTKGQYHLKVDAPFMNCGMKLKRDNGAFLFSQQIVWNKVDEVVERPLVLVDFKCNYTDRYSVMAGPVIPTVTAVDFDTSYGRFTVQMDLYKNRTFSGYTKFNTRPVIAVDQEVCVQQNLINVMSKNLVLTMMRCWASTNKDGSGQTHTLLRDKCVSDPSTFILSNGNASEAQFCFRMFKWRPNMDAIFLHCYVSVCNKTAFPEFCSCDANRKKRNVDSEEPGPREDGTLISSEQIRVVKSGKLDDWESFLGPGGGFHGVKSYDVDRNLMPENREIPKDQNTDRTIVLISVGVVLVVAIIMLGVACGVFISCRRNRSRTKQTNPLDESTLSSHSQAGALPLA